MREAIFGLERFPIAENLWMHNSSRKSVGRVLTSDKDEFVVQWSKWKYQAKERKAIEELTTFVFDSSEEFLLEYERFNCTQDEYTSCWGRYGDAIFPKLLTNH